MSNEDLANDIFNIEIYTSCKIHI